MTQFTPKYRVGDILVANGEGPPHLRYYLVKSIRIPNNRLHYYLYNIGLGTSQTFSKEMVEENTEKV